MKIKLKIKHIIDNEISDYLIDAIKIDNKYTYILDTKKYTILNNINSVDIKITDENIVNNIHFEKNNTYSYININNNRLDYDIVLQDIFISNKLIDIKYKNDYTNRYILEEENGR